MDRVKVSILVPAYNVEDYLDECLQSLISQTLKEIEIVVVDDGSTDSTLSIARQYIADDSRIRVIELPEHQGVSVARKECLNQARGEYIAFVDSDDYISAHAIEGLYERAKSTCADVVLGSMLYCYPDGRQIRVGDKSSVFRSADDVFSGQESFKRMIEAGCYVPMLCGNMYRTAFIKGNELHFGTCLHEDEYFTPFALFHAKRVENGMYMSSIFTHRPAMKWHSVWKDRWHGMIFPFHRNNSLPMPLSMKNVILMPFSIIGHRALAMAARYSAISTSRGIIGWL